MFRTFTNFEDLLKAVEADRNIRGEGASTANRFPVRFVLFDNFRDCCKLVEHISRHLPNINVQRIEDWMDKEYPDVFMPHDKLARKILQLIRSTPSEYRIIMPFSEIARFYDNRDRLEFDALISTIKGFDTEKEGFEHKQRIYIPIVGLEGKMQHFRNDAQSFIWYYQNPDRQLDYRLIMTNGTTYDVKGLEKRYNIAGTLTEWLGCWRYPELKQNIICTSKSIYSHSGYAKPDNAFEFCKCENAYQFLTTGLKLDVDCIPYNRAENAYWNTLASRVNIENFQFEKFFNELFGINRLSGYKQFFELWFKNKEPFMRWLLSKYYVYKFCGKGYVCRVLQQLNGYSDTAFVTGLALAIFSMENQESYIEERNEGLKQSEKNGIELAHDVQSYLIEKIKNIEADAGISSAIKYVSCMSYAEKALVIEWYRAGKVEREDLARVYPDLYYYLCKTVASAEDTWVLDYIDKYKEAKVKNTYTDDVKNYISDKNKNHVEHFKWSNKFSTTKTILSARTDIQCYLWIDGLGIDWISFISQTVKECEAESYYLNEVYVATAKVPTRTDINRADIQDLSGGLFEKVGDLDEIAHSCRPYPKYIIDDLETVRNSIHQFLIEHPGMKIAIVSDHGISYLSQLLPGYNLKGYKSDHYGRIAEATMQSKASVVSDDKYDVIKMPDGKTISLCALKHESLMAKIPEGMGCHGGCTPEEQLVPVMIISPEKTVATWRSSLKSFEVEEANPIIVYEIVGLVSSQIPFIEYNNKNYALSAKGSLYTSERLQLVKDVTKVKLRIGTWEKEDTFTIKMAVVEDDLFDF
ncbi:MAG: BREX-4 system phosphatase PglZ [Prevotella sp.]|nr:BREX-4 system phosphatase PglZ [Prevotella sp.]